MLGICLMVSGHLGDVVLDYILSKNYNLVTVLTNSKSTDIIRKCKNNNIPLYVGNPRGEQLDIFIEKYSFDILLSINYLYIINSNLINRPNKYAINFHGSLLPKYRGRTPHVWAIINGEHEAGVTAHLIESDVDTGDIIAQIKLDISPEDTGGDILKRYETIYPNLVDQIIKDIESENILLSHQNHRDATYYGQRRPEDGRINWDWSKERIKNWIRAQADPYPGAFTFWDKHKIVVHKSSFHKFGYDYRTPNGTILHTENRDVIVKTTNGALLLTDMDYNDSIDLQPKIILG